MLMSMIRLMLILMSKMISVFLMIANSGAYGDKADGIQRDWSFQQHGVWQYYFKNAPLVFEMEMHQNSN